MKYVLKYWYVVVLLIVAIIVAIYFKKIQLFFAIAGGTAVLKGIEEKKAIISTIDNKRKVKNEKLKNQTYSNTNLDNDPIIRAAQRKRARDKKNKS